MLARLVVARGVFGASLVSAGVWGLAGWEWALVAAGSFVVADVVVDEVRDTVAGR